MPETQNATAERLEEIKDEVKELIREATSLIRKSGNSLTYERARSYWIAHIRQALDKDHDYFGGSMFTMEDTIRELTEDEYEDDEFEDEE